MTEYFENEMFPQALIIGCSYEEFWYSDAKIFWQYVKAYNLKKQSELEEWKWKTDSSTWLFGDYVALAISSCFDEKSKYPQSPIPTFSAKPKTEQEKQEEKKQEATAQEDYFRDRFAQIKDMLSNNNQTPKVIIGERR